MKPAQKDPAYGMKDWRDCEVCEGSAAPTYINTLLSIFLTRDIKDLANLAVPQGEPERCVQGAGVKTSKGKGNAPLLL